jgi:hypothetical protein
MFNQFGDLERCALRAGNVHSADGWKNVLEPIVARYRGKVSRLWSCKCHHSASNFVLTAGHLVGVSHEGLLGVQAGRLSVRGGIPASIVQGSADRRRDAGSVAVSR